MQLRIPSRFEQSLADFLEMPQDDRLKVITAIQKAPVVLGREKLAKHVSTETSIEKKKITGIVAMLASLYRVMENTPIDEFIDDFHDAANSIDKTSKIDIDWDIIKKDLKTVLSSDRTFGITSKAMDILGHYPNTYCSSRILTDIRPVFGQDTNELPPAAMVIHTLRMSFHEESSSTKDFYISLDSQDLKELSRLIERAVKKEATLKSLIGNTEIEYLDLEDN